MRRSASPLPSLGLVAAFFVSVFAARCAKSQCSLNSDCGYRRFCDLDNLCRQDCAEDRDCPTGHCDPNGRCQKGPAPDAAPDDVVVDAAPDLVEDTAPDVISVDRTAPVDVPVAIDTPPPIDMPPPPVDLPPPPVDRVVAPDLPPPPPDLPPPPPDIARPLAGLLDPCVLDDDCQSRACGRFGAAGLLCTRTCATRRDCPNGTVCGSGRCVPDDTGTPCDARTAVPCAQYCYTTTGSTVAHCTHDCGSGADCPAGYACQNAGTASVCVRVETPCARAADCATSLCLDIGCTSACRTAADCPTRLPGLTPYTCDAASGGVRVCNPPRATTPGAQGYVAGGDAMGSVCTPTGVNRCRSAVCDDGESPAVCVQGCTPSGGCPVGWGCKPWLPDGPAGDIYLACRPAGSGAVGTTCTRGSDCATALCQGVTATTGYCTRLCGDGLCPTGMSCTFAGTTVDGTRISLCTRP